MNTKRLIHLTKLAFGTTVVSLSILYCAKMLLSNWQKIQAETFSFQAEYIIGAIAFTSLHFVMLSFGWQILTRVFKCSIPLKIGIPVWFVTYLGRYIPGKVLFVLGRVMAYNSLGTRIGPTTYATILDNIFHIYAALIVGSATMTFVPGFPVFWKFILCGGTAGLSVLLLNPHICNFILKRMASKRQQNLEECHVPVTFLKLAGMTVIYAAAYIPLTLGLYYFSKCFTDIPFAHAPWLAGSLGCAMAAGILAIVVPSGLGVREGMFTLLLQFFFAANIAVVFSLATRFMMTVAELLCVGLSALALLVQHKSLKMFTVKAKHVPDKHDS
jgi:hypothetical protein